MGITKKERIRKLNRLASARYRKTDKYKKKYKNRDKEKINKCQREYYSIHKDDINKRARARAWNKRNPFWRSSKGKEAWGELNIRKRTAEK